MTPTTDTCIPVDAPQTANWKVGIKIGQIVLFRFPIRENASEEQPKLRPCLVLNTRRMLGKVFVELAYGTSAQTTANKGYEVRILRDADANEVGLSRPTRFIGARRVIVSLDNPGFDVNLFDSPVVGQLTGELFERLNAVRARLQAEADMAQATREERKREARDPLRLPAKVEVASTRTARGSAPRKQSAAR